MKRSTSAIDRLSAIVLVSAIVAGCGGDDRAGPDDSVPGATTPSASNTPPAASSAPASPTQPTASSALASTAPTRTTEVDEVTVLRIGTDDEPGRPAADQIEYFVAEVEERSAGSLQVEPEWSAAGDQTPDWDQAVAELVMSGELEMGLIPARSWDVLGVESLRSLHAPFLVTSQDLLDKVVADPLADEMLAGLEEVGITGLSIVPEGLRRVFSFGDPLLSAAQFEGITVRAPTSLTTNAAMQALGAEVDDFATPPEAFYDGVTDGTIAAAESSFAFAGTLPRATTTAGNVVLYPKANVFVVNTASFALLDDEQQQVLRDAAAATRDWAVGVNSTEDELAAEFCAAGGTIVTATDADVASLTDGVAPVYDSLAENPDTAAMIERIRALAGALPSGGDAPSCDPPANANVPIPPAPSVPGGAEVRLVVDTQLGAAASAVVEATGAFQGCTSVRDLDAEATDFNLDITIYSGTKEIICPGGNVIVHYDAMTDERQPGISTGTWSVVSSNLTGVATGGGQVNGDASDCTPLPESDACLIDTLTGAVTD
jgi:TRAP-type C4-dicarboxylate transport system substrate-binding protein